MFERFTDRARRVLVLAQEEARLLDHNFIGTEHVLLGLIGEGEGVAAQALTWVGVRLEAAREEVERRTERAGSGTTGSPPFTTRAKKVLELALREALQRHHDYIGTEHLLLGLLREGEGAGIQALVSLGVDLGVLRQRVFHVLGEAPLDPGEPPGSRRPIPTRSGLLSVSVPFGPRAVRGRLLPPEFSASGAVELTHRDGRLTGTIGGQNIDISLDLPANDGRVEGDLGNMAVSANWTVTYATAGQNATTLALHGELGPANLGLVAWVHFDPRLAFDEGTITGHFSAEPVWAHVEEGEPGTFTGTFASYGIFAGSDFSLRGTVTCGSDATVSGAVAGHPIALRGEGNQSSFDASMITGTWEGPTALLLIVCGAILFHM